MTKRGLSKRLTRLENKNKVCYEYHLNFELDGIKPKDPRRSAYEKNPVKDAVEEKTTKNDEVSPEG